jgi:alkylation response protein AidB-like acyl-CoA dehydrogenase
LWKVLTAAAMVGLAQRALALAAEYVKQRKAFGTLIASFQGVAHPLADAATACDGARLLVQKAARSTNRESGALDRRLASMAFAFAVETARQTTRISAHVHGGYGASTEVDIQLYHAAAMAWPMCGPTPSDEYLAIGREVIESKEAL